MDVAYYLSELLGQLGEVNVPGLGYFAQIRVEGYYNEQESAFYPPKNKVQFDQQIIDDDDDTLAQYIAEKKNISLASSRYFTEKYISNLKQEATLNDVPLANLGHLYIQGNTITFKPADVMANDPAVFGYSPVHLDKLEGPSVINKLESYNQVTKSPETEKPEPVKEPELTTAHEPLKLPEPDPAYELPPAQTMPVTFDSVIEELEAYYKTDEPHVPPVIPPVVHTPVSEAEIHQPETHEPEPFETAPYQPEPEPYIAPVKPEDQEEFVFHGKTYEPNRKNYSWIWISLLVLILLAAGGLFAIYQFKPATFNRLRGMVPAPVKLKTPLRTDSSEQAKYDSLKRDSLRKDSIKNKGVIVDPTLKNATATAPVDTFKQVRFELESRPAFKILAQAEDEIKTYEDLGLKASVEKNTIGPLIKVTLGTYFKKEDAVKAKQDIIKTGKVSADRLQIQPYNPKE